MRGRNSGKVKETKDMASLWIARKKRKSKKSCFLLVKISED